MGYVAPLLTLDAAPAGRGRRAAGAGRGTLPAAARAPVAAAHPQRRDPAGAQRRARAGLPERAAAPSGAAVVAAAAPGGSRLPAARALREGTLEAKDYRGVPVLAAVRGVPEAPSWVLEAKVDRDGGRGARSAARAPAGRARPDPGGHLTAGVVVLLVAPAARARPAPGPARRAGAPGPGAALRRPEPLRQRRHRAHGRRGPHPRGQRARAGLLRLRPRGADRAGRAPPAGAGAGRGSFDEQWRLTRERGGVVFETTHRRRDGTVFPVEVSSRAIDVEGRSFHQAIVRDVTERKAAEQRILRLGQLYAALSQMNQTIARGLDREDLFRELCRVAVGLRRLQVRLGGPGRRLDGARGGGGPPRPGRGLPRRDRGLGRPVAAGRHGPHGHGHPRGPPVRLRQLPGRPPHAALARAGAASGHPRQRRGAPAPARAGDRRAQRLRQPGRRLQDPRARPATAATCWGCSRT